MSSLRKSLPPICPACKGILRPEVVLFEELLSAEALNKMHQELAQGFDLIFSIGTTSGFPYIVAPIYTAMQEGTPTIEINPDTTEISRIVTLKLTLKASVALEQISGFIVAWKLTEWTGTPVS